MSLPLLAALALAAWLWFTDRLSATVLQRIVAGVVAAIALRLGFEGSALGGIVLGAAAVALFVSSDAGVRRAASELTRARALLGVGADAGPDAIRAAYLRRAAAAHPDRGGDTAQMQALNAARDLLLRRARGPAKAR